MEWKNSRGDLEVNSEGRQGRKNTPKPCRQTRLGRESEDTWPSPYLRTGLTWVWEGLKAASKLFCSESRKGWTL